VLATDCAVIPTPSFEQRLDQVRFITGMARSMGIAEPKVSLVSCIEKINEKHLPFSATYPDVVSRAETGEFGPCKVFGPLDLKTSVDVVAARDKHISSEVAGNADCLVFPDIVSANVFYKTLTLFPGTETAALLVGATVPVVMPSRADSALTKLHSLMLASLKS
jgi:phosphate butyryltransferase